MNKTYMLDTNICSFIMREQPAAVLTRLAQTALRNQRIVVSAITYSEMRFDATGPKASPRHIELVNAFCARLNAILPWDRNAVNATTDVRVALRLAGTPIGPNVYLIQLIDSLRAQVALMLNFPAKICRSAAGVRALKRFAFRAVYMRKRLLTLDENRA